ncbi:MAG: DNA mismatch repair protein MutS [Dehalococcoidales bacterium]|nr:DNA mismatch repair protein MutS [Dehalococcoidales bacterium]
MRDSVTPIRQQYLRIKRKYPQAIVLFRLGDFYETFDEDAKTTSRELEIVLTSREMGKGNKVPMAGIPYHAIDNYLAKLINRGYKVAICEQITKPGETKGIVQREVIRVVTPGTVIEPGLLESKKNNYLLSLVADETMAGIAYVDITTSQFATTQLPINRVRTELERLKPSEVIIAQDAELPDIGLTPPPTKVDNYWFDGEVARQALFEHFGVTTLEGYGCAHLPLAIRAAGAIIHYLEETQKGALAQLSRLSTYSTDSFMALDNQAQTNLEIFRAATGAYKGSLLSVIDQTKTAMGGRLLKRWLSQPLLDIKELTKRQDAIAWFVEQTLARARLITLLNQTADIERLINRIAGGNALPIELIALRRTLENLPEVLEILSSGASSIDWLKDSLKLHPEVIELISRALVDEPSNSIGEGGVIRAGFSEELDHIRSVSTNARQYLAGLERTEQEKTGIKSLRIGYNRVFGYYIEVSKSNLAQVPQTYIRKQTLANGERYFTPELKEYESTILNAKERINELETALFQQVCKQVSGFRQSILTLADALSHLDVFSSLAEVAVRNSYHRPQLTEDDEIIITQGRHPVVERSLTDTAFVPNDTRLSNKDMQVIILTGPNMAGKSTYLKQVALIVLLAQIGSFVPAESATIGLVDRIFTRIGAREDLVSGQSTFMIEMVETANILNNATPRSLLILDEIGRGTSTYDGLSIARAVAEYIHNHPRLGAKTLFATHYHEMVQLADYLPRVRNFNVAVKEERGEVIFLRKIIPGGVDRSYGIHVAKLAGLPRSVVHRAQEVLDELETENGQQSQIGRKRGKKETVQQMPMFVEKSPVLEELSKLEIDSLTPLEALTKLYELQKRAREGNLKQ